MKPIILYLIQRDINRFGVLRRSMPKISKKVLTEQLRELENDDLIEYRLKIVFVVWFGSHAQYDKIDAKKVSYAKANKK